MKTALLFLTFCIFSSVSWSAPAWEKQGDLYFLTKNSHDYFSASGAGSNQFSTKYLTYDKTDFLVKAPDSWKDYGRLNLEGNNLFSLPIKEGTKVEEIHLLAGGNFSNAYKHDLLLGLYGENYYYGNINLLFIYMNGSIKQLSVPIFWDWFHLPLDGQWSREGARIKSLGNNPVRKNCAIYHIVFANPKPAEALKAVLVSDNWLEDLPFSDIFAVTVKSKDLLESIPKVDK